MKTKSLKALMALLIAVVMLVSLVACDPTGDGAMSAEDAAKKIEGFTTSPTTIDATFKQTYKLEVNSENASMKAFEKDIADTVTIQADFTAGNLYYYGKRVSKDNSVMEQLVVKEGDSYVAVTTTTVKETLANEAAAKTKIDELMTALSKQTAGYVDSGAFVYGKDWVHTYLMLGSGTVKGSESSYFTYKYSETENSGLKTEIDMKYVGYYGDAGVFEFGTDSTHTGASATIETNDKGYITSFSQTLNNHLDMAIVNPPVPLDLTGTRSITASYNGTITKKATSDIAQTLNKPTVTFADGTNYTVSVTDMVITGQAPSSMEPMTSGDEIEIGHWVAVRVTPADGYEVTSVTVGGKATQQIAGYYCYNVKEADYNTELKVAVAVKTAGADENTPGTIVLDPATVEHTTSIKTFDFDYSSFAFVEGTTVAPGHFVALQIVCETGWIVDTVKVNGNDATFINGYYCYMTAVVAGEVYTVEVTVAEKANVTVNTVEGATIKLKGLNYGATKVYRDGAVAVGEFICVVVTLDTDHANYTVTATVNGAAMSDQFNSAWQDEGNAGILLCYVAFGTPGNGATASGTAYNVVVTLTAPQA